MPRTRLVSLFAGAVAAGALVLGGCASPAAHGAAASGTAAKVPVADSMSERAPAAGAVHFIGYSKNSDGPYFTVIVTGAIGDYGPAVTVHPNGTVDPQHSSQLRLDLKHGSVRLSIAKLDQKLIRADSKWRSNPTCSFHVGVTAPTPTGPAGFSFLFNGTGTPTGHPIITTGQGDRCPGSMERGAVYYPHTGYPCAPSEVPTGP